MRLLVTGASGYLGRSVVRRARPRCEVVAAGRDTRRLPPGVSTAELDLRRPAATREVVGDLRPDAILNLAAINPGGDEGAMEAVNARGAAAMAHAAGAIGARLVHVSTDVVLDGREAPYDDEAPTHPLSEYGRTKAAGEVAVLAADPRAAVVRTSLIYGLEEIDRGTATLAARLARGEPVQLYGDVLRQPIWVESLATALLQLVESRFSGRINVAGGQVLSRDGYGRRLLDYWKVPGRERVETVSARVLGVSVPCDLRLRLDRAERHLTTPLPGVDEVLARRGTSGEPLLR